MSAHEISHALTRYTANLICVGESGGLNEATSDIFASMVEFHANNPLDPPDYIIGENVVLPEKFPNGGMRFMFDPSKDGKSMSCWTSSANQSDVHHVSGIGNHFFYLLAEGSSPAAPLPASPTCNASTVTGIGREKAAKIWFRALTVYMLSYSDYAHARIATTKAARDLFGAGSIEVSAVRKAWDAVNVAEIKGYTPTPRPVITPSSPLPRPTGSPATPAPRATLTPAHPVPRATISPNQP